MAAPEAQNANGSNAPVADAPARSVLTGHDWVIYVMALGAVLIIVGAPLVLLGDAWNRSEMLLIGAVCYTVATAVWTGLLVFFTWKVVETGRIAIPLLWRRILRWAQAIPRS